MLIVNIKIQVWKSMSLKPQGLQNPRYVPAQASQPCFLQSPVWAQCLISFLIVDGLALMAVKYFSCHPWLKENIFSPRKLEEGKTFHFSISQFTNVIMQILVNAEAREIWLYIKEVLWKGVFHCSAKNDIEAGLIYGKETPGFQITILVYQAASRQQALMSHSFGNWGQMIKVDVCFVGVCSHLLTGMEGTRAPYQESFAKAPMEFISCPSSWPHYFQRASLSSSWF